MLILHAYLIPFYTRIGMLPTTLRLERPTELLPCRPPVTLLRGDCLTDGLRLAACRTFLRSVAPLSVLAGRGACRSWPDEERRCQFRILSAARQI